MLAAPPVVEASTSDASTTGRAEREAVPLALVRQRTTAATGGLAGSALSPATWAKAVDAVREMTVRR